MAGKIFVSYRRDDVAGDARGIRDALAASFGHANVFMDVDDLLAGQRFDKELNKALDDCDVLIAVIGPRWIDLLKSRTQSGERDYVREEIASALQRGIVVIPTRVGLEGRLPPLPRRDDLPDDIRDLVLHQKHDVTHERFGRDVTDLIGAIEATYARIERDESDLPAVMRTVEPIPSAQSPPPIAHATRHRAEAHAEADIAAHANDFLEDAEPPRVRRLMSFAATFLGVVGVGALAYIYVNHERVPLVKANVKVKPEHGGKEFPVTDKKDTMPAKVGQEPEAAGPRPVKTIPTAVPVPPPAPPPVPGITLQDFPPLRAEPTPPVKLKEVPPTSGTGSYVVVLSSKKSSVDALKVYADLQQEHGDVLAAKVPQIQEIDMSARGLGTMYRLVVGPPGSREAATSLCNQLKAVRQDCWVTAY